MQNNGLAPSSDAVGLNVGDTVGTGCYQDRVSLVCSIDARLDGSLWTQ